VIRLYLHPEFAGEDTGDGGVRRVVEAQRREIPKLGHSFTETPADADLIACHVVAPDQFLKVYPEKPLVAHCHGLYWNEHEWEKWAYDANSEVLKLICVADVVTAPSEWVAQVIRRHTSRDVRVVPHGVNTREWTPLGEESRGYVLWNKTRLDAVCTAEPLDMLVRIMPEQTFVSTYGTQAENLALTGRVSYETAKNLVRHAGVYLATSRETFGIGTLEAMSAGVPVVGFRWGGQAEFIEHEVDGWLVEPGDVQGLADGVRWALQNREDVGKAARAKAQTFTWRKAAQQYCDIYQEMIGRYTAYAERPRATVIITAYKLAKYLPDAINSVIAQDDPNWECIVVDDDSPDECGDIADSFAEQDERIKVIHNDKNQYLAEARNTGIAQAMGKYILPLDADDQLAPTTVRVLADALDVDRSLSIAYGNVLFVNEDGVTPTDYGLPRYGAGHSGWPAEFDPWEQAKGRNYLPYSSMYRREVWRLTGGYRRRLKTAEDADLWTRASSFGFRTKMVSDGDTLIYRNREGSMSRTENEHRYDYIRWFPWAKDATLAPAGLSGMNGVSLREPKVSVIIPVGPGHEQYVQDAVDSVQAQSYPNWEIVVVNDSGARLHLPVWAHVVPSTARDAGAARNIGIRASTTDLFLPLDADDYLQPDALQWLLTAFAQNGSDKIVYCDFFEDPKQEGVFTSWGLPDWQCDLLIRTGAIHTVTALTPKHYWKQVGGYAEGINWEDWDFQMRVAEAGICSIHLSAALFTYRKHTGMRRNWADGTEFDRRKDAIYARWGEYFKGDKKFMACGCQGAAKAPAQSMSMDVPAGMNEAVKVQYTGNRAGASPYRGNSGTIYYFDIYEPIKFVLAQDVELFMRLEDFVILRESSPSGTLEPVLT